MSKSRARYAALAAALIFALAAAPLRAAPLGVVTSFSILADFARQVGGDRVEVRALVGPDEDAHAYQPRPSDARLILNADVVIANGMGFDSWIERLVASTGTPRPIVIASDGVKAIEDDGSHAHHEHDHGSLDPHAWQDVANAKIYASNIALALESADPDGAEVYRANLARYTAALNALDAEIRASMSVLPPSKRKVVTSHDAFGYFGKAYGIRFLAAAGVSNHSDVSAAGMARLIRQLRRENVPAVFVENINDQRLIERITKEGGARLGGTLYSDALSSANGAAPTYVDMMRANLQSLMGALAPDTP